MINKTDLAAAVGADLAVMERDALRMRDGGPFVFAQVYLCVKTLKSPRLYIKFQRKFLNLTNMLFHFSVDLSFVSL